MKYTAQAEKLNEILILKDSQIFDMLSERGKSFYFPKEGIIKQTEEANGKSINATVGVALDENKSTYILKSMSESISDSLTNDSFSYAPSGGLKELRNHWKQQIGMKNPSLKGNLGFPIVTSGLTHALSIVGSLFLDKEDTIIMPDFFWGNYKLMFETNFSSKISTFNMFDGLSFNLEGFKEAILNTESNKVVLLLNFPNNPTGYSPSVHEILEMKEILLKLADSGRNIIVMIDDAYFGLFYEKDTCKESVFAYLNDIHKNILPIKIDGISKEDYAWGLRVGFITFGGKIASESIDVLEQKTLGIIRSNISNTNRIAQEMLMKTYKNPKYPEEKKEHFNLLKSRYEKVKEVLENSRYSAFFTSFPFNSGYFMSIRLKGGNAEKIRKILLERYDTGVISIGNDVLRIAFSSVPLESIKKLFDNIYEACQEY
ncbi:MAG: aminotransferase class I/II-fold pyridoxal phosphate-dependent enzyme [Candidatus Gracilibacteria bacterium]|nr:aminotransferase class I/II-fold pyridoxal phosphate-dependent enzyme [Candidatus Gracilibacteria bacterium]